MKATLQLIMYIMLIGSLGVHAQQFSPTAGGTCYNCHPANYTMDKSPSISDVWNPLGSLDDKWNLPGFLLPLPPSTYSQGLPSGQGKNSFVTLKTSGGIYDDKLYITVTGFIVGKTYEFRYSVLSASVHYEAGNNSPFGESATMDIVTVNQNPVASHTTNFPAVNRNKWIDNVITFVPSASTLQFSLSGETSGASAGYVNFSIDKYPFDCMLPNTQVEMGRTSFETIFPGDKMDLHTVQIKSPTPETGELVWKAASLSTYPTLTADEASHVPISNPVNAGNQYYFPFYYAKDFNCYNVPVSQLGVQFMHVPTQVPLKNTYINVSCTEPTGNLTSLLDNPVAPVIWFTTNNHQGSQVVIPQAVPPGDYYAFYYDINKGGYSLTGNNLSAAHVKVENPIMPGTPDLGPTLDINSLIFPANGSKDFVVNIFNTAGNSNCSVFFKILKSPGFTISYSTEAGTSNVNGGVFNNNDFWTFSEDPSFITVTSKYGIAANGYSAIGFKITRKANTPANSAQNITVTIPQQGGGGEINAANNALMRTVTGI